MYRHLTIKFNTVKCQIVIILIVNDTENRVNCIYASTNSLSTMMRLLSHESLCSNTWSTDDLKMLIGYLYVYYDHYACQDPNKDPCLRNKKEATQRTKMVL